MPDPCPDACKAYADKAADTAAKGAQEHSKKNVATIAEQLQKEIRDNKLAIARLDDTIRGSSDGQPGLAARARENTRRIDAMEQAMTRKLDELIDELRMTAITNHGRTPKHGTVVESADSERPKRKDSGSFNISVPNKMVWVIAAFVVGGPTGAMAIMQQVTAPKEQAVQVTAEALAQRERELKEKEERLQRQMRWQNQNFRDRRTTEPTMPEPAPADPVAPEGSAE